MRRLHLSSRSQDRYLEVLVTEPLFETSVFAPFVSKAQAIGLVVWLVASVIAFAGSV